MEETNKEFYERLIKDCDRMIADCDRAIAGANAFLYASYATLIFLCLLPIGLWLFS